MTDPPSPGELAPGTTADLVVTLYAELQAIARRLRREDRPEHTLETSALVHEAFLRLANQHATAWQSRAYFLGAAATTMRRVLVDHARQRNAGKRDGGVRTTLVSGVADTGGATPLDVLVLDDVLSRLATLDPRQAQVVELRVSRV
jgi:RNA polymerase sigma-70 factor (ECF subfamily)